MKHRRKLTCLIVVFALAAGFGPLARAQAVRKNEGEEARAYNVTRTVKTVEGLNFVVEEDRPIEKINGIYRPIDLDSYVALKFNKLQKTMEEKFAALQQRIAALEAEVAALKAKKDPSAQHPPASK